MLPPEHRWVLLSLLTGSITILWTAYFLTTRWQRRPDLVSGYLPVAATAALLHVSAWGFSGVPGNLLNLAALFLLTQALFLESRQRNAP